MLKKIKHAVCAGILLLALIDCGGGTAGTSSTGGDLRVRQISGSVQDTDGLPVTGALIEVAGGAASTTTDGSGLFTLDAETGTTVALNLETGSVNSVISTEVDPASTSVTVEAVVDRRTNAASARSLNADIVLSGDCNLYGTQTSNRVDLQLPSGRIECTLAYRIRSHPALTALPRLVTHRSNCGGVAFLNFGAETAGAVTTMTQGLNVKGQRGVCVADVTVESPGVLVPPRFNFKISQEASGAAQPTPNPSKLNYSGTLTREPNATGLTDCPRFNQRTLPVQFQVRNNTIEVTFRGEGVAVSGPVNSSGRDVVARYSLKTSISGIRDYIEELSISPARNFGSTITQFIVLYSARDSSTGEPTCTNAFSGTLK